MGRVPPHISEGNKEKRKDVQLLSGFSQNLSYQVKRSFH